MGMKIYVVGIIVVFTLVLSSIALTPTTALQASSKGLKLYLTVDSNQGSQDGTIQTSPYGRVVDTRLQYITQGNYQYELRYQKGQVDNGDFQICVTLNNGVNNCNTGYDGPEKKPVNVYVNLQAGDPTPMVLNDGNSQAQSSSNENNNNNTLSQSQETKIYICNDEGCKIQ
jgi:hypothetical protein